MSKRQNSLIESWSKAREKKKRSSEEVESAECIELDDLSSGSSDDEFQRDIRESDEADYSDLEEGSLERVGLLSFNQAAIAIQGVYCFYSINNTLHMLIS